MMIIIHSIILIIIGWYSRPSFTATAANSVATSHNFTHSLSPNIRDQKFIKSWKSINFFEVTQFTQDQKFISSWKSISFFEVTQFTRDPKFI